MSTVVEQELPAPVPVDAAAAVRALVDDPALVELVLQPIVDLEQVEVAGWEALMRAPAAWHQPPDALFDAAAGIGLSSRLERVVLERTVDLLATLPENRFLTVNLDPSHLADPVALEPLHGAPSLARLVIEVTEKRWPDDDVVLDSLALLRARSALVAADDVGAGYASLSQVMRLRPDIVKLDRALIAGLGEDVATETMVRTLGELCGSLDAWVVAEGVETTTQLAALSRLGVPLVQGWLLGRPGPGWPALDDPDAVRGHALAGTFAESVVSLLVELPAGYERGADGRHRLEPDGPPCTTVAPSTGLTDAVRRAVSRSRERRWDPLVVTDATGRAIGYVPMEQLVVAATGA